MVCHAKSLNVSVGRSTVRWQVAGRTCSFDFIDSGSGFAIGSRRGEHLFEVLSGIFFHARRNQPYFTVMVAVDLIDFATDFEIEALSVFRFSEFD